MKKKIRTKCIRCLKNAMQKVNEGSFAKINRMLSPPRRSQSKKT